MALTTHSPVWIMSLNRLFFFEVTPKLFFLPFSELDGQTEHWMYTDVCHCEDTGSNSHILVPWMSGIKYIQSLCPKNVSNSAAVHVKIPNFAFQRQWHLWWSIKKDLCAFPTQEGIFACSAAELEDTNLEKNFHRISYIY